MIAKKKLSVSNPLPKISIITPSYNRAGYLERTIQSVINQGYPKLEYIIVDGGSTDGTVEMVQGYGDKIAKFISESDKGLYDAMNKGIKLATGDIVGILNSDDLYINEFVIEKIVKLFEEKKVDSVFADLVYVRPEDINKTVRYYDSSQFNPEKFAYGWMPAHPTFFVKRSAYEIYGLFKTDYKIAADYELLVRFLYKYRLTYFYLQEVIIKMRMGGASTSGLKSNWVLNQEIIRACKENDIETNILKVLSKYPKKLLGLWSSVNG